MGLSPFHKVTPAQHRKDVSEVFENVDSLDLLPDEIPAYSLG